MRRERPEALEPIVNFLASGHPDRREDLPPHLGLIESTDAGVLRVMQEGRDCEDVVTRRQVSRGLDRAGVVIVAPGFQQCLTDGEGTESVDVKKMETLLLSLA